MEIIGGEEDLEFYCQKIILKACEEYKIEVEKPVIGESQTSKTPDCLEGTSNIGKIENINNDGNKLSLNEDVSVHRNEENSMSYNSDAENSSAFNVKHQDRKRIFSYSSTADDDTVSNITDTPSVLTNFLAEDQVSLKPSILKNPLRSNSNTKPVVKTVFDIANDDISERRSVTIDDNDVQIILEFPEDNFDDISFDGEDEEEAPNGGWGWVVVFSAFTINIITIGLHNSFGLLFPSLREEFKTSYSETSWVGSIAFGCILVFAPIAGMLSNKYGCRVVSIAGILIASGSLFVTSFVTSLDAMYFSYGFGFGVGTCLAYMQGLVMVSRYFTTRRAVASGIVLCGSSVGTLVVAPIYSMLCRAIQWRNTMRVFSLVTACTATCAATYRPLHKTSKPPSTPTVEEQVQNSISKRFVLDLSLWKNKAFVVWAISVGLCKFGYLVPFVHLATYAQDLGLPAETGAYLMAVNGLMSGFSRILSGFLADSPRINRLYLSQTSAFLMGVITIVTPSMTSAGGIYAFVIILGLLDGGMEILLPVMTLDLVGADHMSIAWGCLLAVISASAIGPPIAGAIRDGTGSYAGAFYLSGVPMIISTFVLALIPMWAQKQTQPPSTSFLSIDPSHLEFTPSSPSFANCAPTNETDRDSNSVTQINKGAKNDIRAKLTVITRKNPFKKSQGTKTYLINKENSKLSTEKTEY